MSSGKWRAFCLGLNVFMSQNHRWINIIEPHDNDLVPLWANTIVAIWRQLAHMEIMMPCAVAYFFFLIFYDVFEGITGMIFEVLEVYHSWHLKNITLC